MIDTKKEHLAVTEANKLKMPIVAVVDTNCDPDVIQYVIPGNDDAIRAGNLLCRVIAEAVEEGRFIASRRARIAADAAGPAAIEVERDAEEEAERAAATGRGQAPGRAASPGARSPSRVDAGRSGAPLKRAAAEAAPTPEAPQPEAVAPEARRRADRVGGRRRRRQRPAPDNHPHSEEHRTTMAISAKDVQALRQSTGAGMMDAKRALEENNGDAEAAALWLRERGLGKAAERSDRENSEGAIALARNGNVAALVQLRSETDFSAKSPDFVNLANDLAQIVVDKGEDAVSELSSAIDDLKITLKENIDLGQVVRFEAPEGHVLDTYLHVQNGRGVNGILIELDGGTVELAHDIALTAAFSRPSARSGATRSIPRWSRTSARSSRRKRSPRASPKRRSRRSSRASSPAGSSASPAACCSTSRSPRSRSSRSAKRSATSRSSTSPSC